MLQETRLNVMTMRGIGDDYTLARRVWTWSAEVLGLKLGRLGQRVEEVGGLHDADEIQDRTKRILKWV